MNVSLTPQLEALVKRKVGSGLYNSASEVIREALRMLDENDQLRELRLKNIRHDVSSGVEQLEKGNSTTFDDKMVRKIKATGRKKLRSTHTKKPA